MIDLWAISILLFQSAILSVLIVAVRRRDVAAAINTFGSLVLTLLPTVLEAVVHTGSGRALVVAPSLVLWLAVAGFLHSLGMLGPYDSTWWWDHLTHTVSAALVAALLYAAFLVTVPSPTEYMPWPGGVGTLTVVFTFVIGVFWELIELVAREIGDWYDIEPVLVYYGWEDTALDLVFDVVGALVVVVLDVRVFVSTVERFPIVTERLLVASGWLVVLGSITMALFITVSGSRRA